MKNYWDKHRQMWIEKRLCPKCNREVTREIMSDKWFIECCNEEKCPYWKCGFVK